MWNRQGVNRQNEKWMLDLTCDLSSPSFLFVRSLERVEIWEEIKELISHPLPYSHPYLNYSIFLAMSFSFSLKCLSPDINLGSWWQQNLQPCMNKHPTHPLHFHVASGQDQWNGAEYWKKSYSGFSGEACHPQPVWSMHVDHERPYKGFERREIDYKYMPFWKKRKTMETMIRSGDLGRWKDYSFIRNRIYFERHYKDGYMLNLCPNP